MGNDGRVFKRSGASVQEQLFGWHGHDPDPAIFCDALDLHIMDHGCRHHHWLASCWIDSRQLRLVNAWVWVRRNDLDLTTRLLHQHLKSLVIEARIFLNPDLLFVFPPEFGYSAFPDQCIFENRITGQKPVVVILEYIVCVVGRLLGHLHIFWSTGCKLDHILRIKENAHQAWQHGRDSVPHFHGHHLAVAFDLIAE